MKAGQNKRFLTYLCLGVWFYKPKIAIPTITRTDAGGQIDVHVSGKFRRTKQRSTIRDETRGTAPPKVAISVPHSTHPSTHPLCSLASAPRVSRLWNSAV